MTTDTATTNLVDQWAEAIATALGCTIDEQSCWLQVARSRAELLHDSLVEIARLLDVNTTLAPLWIGDVVLRVRQLVRAARVHNREGKQC